MPAEGEAKLQLSLLPDLYGRQSYEASVGALPAFTYRSASPLPPDMVNTRSVAPAGTCSVNASDWPDEPVRPVTGTPFSSTPSPPPPSSPPSTVTGRVRLLLAPSSSVTVNVTS